MRLVAHGGFAAPPSTSSVATPNQSRMAAVILLRSSSRGRRSGMRGVTRAKVWSSLSASQLLEAQGRWRSPEGRSAGRQPVVPRDHPVKVIASSLRKADVVDKDGKLYVILFAENIHPGRARLSLARHAPHPR